MIVSVAGQVLAGFGTAMLLNRDIPFKGLLTTLLLLPMMLSMAVVGLLVGTFEPALVIVAIAQKASASARAKTRSDPNSVSSGGYSASC